MIEQYSQKYDIAEITADELQQTKLKMEPQRWNQSAAAHQLSGIKQPNFLSYILSHLICFKICITRQILDVCNLSYGLLKNQNIEKIFPISKDKTGNWYEGFDRGSKLKITV